jgi:hypothetical protein
MLIACMILGQAEVAVVTQRAGQVTHTTTTTDEATPHPAAAPVHVFTTDEAQQRPQITLMQVLHSPPANKAHTTSRHRQLLDAAATQAPFNTRSLAPHTLGTALQHHTQQAGMHVVAGVGEGACVLQQCTQPG